MVIPQYCQCAISHKVSSQLLSKRGSHLDQQSYKQNQANRMRCLATLLVCVALCWDGLNAVCPEPTAVTDVNGVKLCARFFEDADLVYADSCKGKSMDIYPGEDVPNIPLAWNNRVSSLVVSSRCSLTVWDHYWKEGTKKKFGGGIVYRLREVRKGLIGDWNNDISGYLCNC
ncbi:syncollin-like [Sardina pilchardus]|uniref:syncollin-like n=1 Tax=Sardina pilchardus TaxID=27697 RepID=UPI002E10AB0E